MRIWAISLAMMSLLCLDLGFARIHYHIRLSQIATKRDNAVQMINTCKILESEDCSEICNEHAEMLALERQDHLMAVRDWHVAGRIMGEIFDVHRGQDQLKKVKNLIEEKNCETILKSVGNSNFRANVGSGVGVVLGCLGLWASRTFWMKASSAIKQD
jgi:hypothetical protein